MVNPFGYKYVGSAKAVLVGYGTEFAIDGAIGGTADATARAIYDGEDIGEAVKQGFVSGTIGGILLGGTMKGLGTTFHKIGDKLGQKADITDIQTSNPKTVPKTVKKEAAKIRADFERVTPEEVDVFRLSFIERVMRQDEIEFEDNYFAMLEAKLANNEVYQKNLKESTDALIEAYQKNNRTVPQSRFEEIKRQELEWLVSDIEINLTSDEREFLLDYLQKNTNLLDQNLEIIRTSDRRLLRKVLDIIERKRTNGNTKFDLARNLEDKGILEQRSKLDIFTNGQLYALKEMLWDINYTDAEREIIKNFDWSKIAKSNVLAKITEVAQNNRLLQGYLLKEFLLSPENFAKNAAKIMKKYQYYEKAVSSMPKTGLIWGGDFNAVSLRDFMQSKVSIEDLIQIKEKMDLLPENVRAISLEYFDKLLKIDNKYLKRLFKKGDNQGLRDVKETYEVHRLIDALTIDPALTIRVCKMKDFEGNPRFSYGDITKIIQALKTDRKNAQKLLNSVSTHTSKTNPITDKNIPVYRYSADLISEIIEKNSDPNRKFDYIRLVKMKDDLKQYRIHEDAIRSIINCAEKYPKETMNLLEMKTDNGYKIFTVQWDGEPITSIAECMNKYPEVMNKMLKRGASGYLKYGRVYVENFAKLYLKFPDKMDKIANSELISVNLLCKLTPDNIDYTLNLIDNYKNLEIPPERIPLLVENYGKFSIKQLQKLTKTIGRDNLAKLTNDDLIAATSLIGLYGKTSINEIPITEKKGILRALVSCNEGMFSISDEMEKLFPLVPRNLDEYCTLLPAIVRSLGIETNALQPEQIASFNNSLTGLSNVLARISDTDFAHLKISQTYSKDDFIQNVLRLVKDLPKSERQKVYDYFGFELHHNSGNEITGYSISGYPVNLNNGKKLAEITEPKTKEIVELLRPEVIKFSQNNPIKCDNPQLEKFLNDIVDALPELRAQVGKKQHGAHDYDIILHSLKVMQKIAQDPQFEKLSESDKKLMMLASLLHDITKKEGKRDVTHASESAFDAFYIAKKFNLSREEEIKLYTLAKHHEWLEYVNTSRSEEQLAKRLQSVAYDLQNDNLFDLALMFTHADLRAVKKSDIFHDTVDGKSRLSFDGKTRRSFAESAEVYAKRIREYVLELKKSQPLLPVTQVPTASRIAQAIKTVNPDGSTNIKGVYKDSDGLIVIKFNEVEDWEAIGFPKGTTSRGIKASSGKHLGGEELAEDINTGNLHFFTHGLEYENQLTKFDAFSLPDSDALLSISYAERPESKYRFFRAQGVLLDFETKYVHGGGNKDSGSGLGKSIADFKENYIFGGRREYERIYISELIKKELNMADDEYIRFIKENENKPFTEIYPIELREKLIKTLAAINSNVRNGKRSYNEMYGSNPRRVMGVFAYGMNYIKKVGNPLEFLNNKTVDRFDRAFGTGEPISVYDRTEFLRRYAIEHDIPFFVFGD